MTGKARDLLAPVSRRTFLAWSAGTTLVMGLGAHSAGQSGEKLGEKTLVQDTARRLAPTIWFEVDRSGATLINIAEAEMGQHVGTALARIVADELGADWRKVSIRYVDTDPKWGYRVTGGSWSVFTNFKMLSQAGAAGRMILRDAGAAIIGVSPSECHVENGRVIAGDRSVSFSEIVNKGNVSRTFDEDELGAMPLKSPSDRQFVGKPAMAHDISEKSTGKAVYGLDVERDNMVFACPLIPPTRYGSVILEIDDSAAREIPGYRQVLKLNDPASIIQGWALVIADDFPSAMKAAKAVVIDWKPGATANVTEAEILDEGRRLCSEAKSGALVVDDADVVAARSSAEETHTATYTTGSVLHFTMEPANALVEFVDGKCHVYSGNQWQSLIMPLLANSLDVEESQIVIHPCYLGGGFGRRLVGDSMIPAALAAKQLGRPVKLIFPRDEDSRFDCIRSPSVAKFDASIDSNGNLTGIEHALSAGWPTLALAPGFMPESVDGLAKFDPFSTSGADHWYSIANHRVRSINNELAQRTFLPGWLRAVGAGWIGWGVESFLDELAILRGVDPVQMRLDMLDGSGKNAGEVPHAVRGARRLAEALENVAERAGWGRELPAGEGLGVATCFGQERTMPTWVATIAHVAVDKENKNITVSKIWQTIDCGTVVHPDGAMAQAEGATLWGLSLALHEGTKIRNGAVSDTNLNGYTPLRMSDVPELDIEFVENNEFPTGLGEPPLIPVAPAIGNAIFAASGIRVRDLPIRL